MTWKVGIDAILAINDLTISNGDIMGEKIYRMVCGIQYGKIWKTNIIMLHADQSLIYGSIDDSK